MSKLGILSRIFRSLDSYKISLIEALPIEDEEERNNRIHDILERTIRMLKTDNEFFMALTEEE